MPVTSNERNFFGTCNRLMRLMCSEDVAENIAATRAFLRRCFAAPLPQELFEELLAVNMMVPPQVRAGLFGRAADYDAVLAGLDLPVLVVQGERDEMVARPWRSTSPPWSPARGSTSIPAWGMPLRRGAGALQRCTGSVRAAGPRPPGGAGLSVASRTQRE